MGTYASNQDLIDRFEDADEVAYLTDVTDPNNPDLAVLTEVINGAEGQFNAYVARRYAVPIDTTSESALGAMIKSIVLDIAVYRLTNRRHRLTPAREAAYANAQTLLQDIVKGIAVLPGVATPISAASDEPEIAWGSGGDYDPDISPRRMSREAFKGM